MPMTNDDDHDRHEGDGGEPAAEDDLHALPPRGLRLLGGLAFLALALAALLLLLATRHTAGEGSDRMCDYDARSRELAGRGFQHVSTKAAISFVSRFGATRSSISELASSNRAPGSSAASIPASEKGWMRSY